MARPKINEDNLLKLFRANAILNTLKLQGYLRNRELYNLVYRQMSESTFNDYLLRLIDNGFISKKGKEYCLTTKAENTLSPKTTPRQDVLITFENVGPKIFHDSVARIEFDKLNMELTETVTKMQQIWLGDILGNYLRIIDVTIKYIEMAYHKNLILGYFYDYLAQWEQRWGIESVGTIGQTKKKILSYGDEDEILKLAKEWGGAAHYINQDEDLFLLLEDIQREVPEISILELLNIAIESKRISKSLLKGRKRIIKKYFEMFRIKDHYINIWHRMMKPPTSSLLPQQIPRCDINFSVYDNIS